MALDARLRSSIYHSLVPILGDEAANALMSEFPSIEADELVTKQFLRAELALTRGELRMEMGELRTELRTEVGHLRVQMAELQSTLTLRIGAAIVASTALMAGVGLFA